ncbi:MAG: LysR family transcriptional regulator [Rhizobiales bacterium]|nr:LysR family transcriptional regulator [Hyphomicrobiales bacterium]
MHEMDIAQLALLADVYRAGAFAPVARTRGLAPSSISRAIAVIEEEIGALLFQRTTRALTPTDAGEAFYLRIAPLAEEFEAARARRDARQSLAAISSASDHGISKFWANRARTPAQGLSGVI